MCLCNESFCNKLNIWNSELVAKIKPEIRGVASVNRIFESDVPDNSISREAFGWNPDGKKIRNKKKKEWVVQAGCCWSSKGLSFTQLIYDSNPSQLSSRGRLPPLPSSAVWLQSPRPRLRPPLPSPPVTVVTLPPMARQFPPLLLLPSIFSLFVTV